MTVWRHTQLSDEFLPSVVHHLALLWRNMRQLETSARYCHKNTDWCSFIYPIFDQSLYFVPILYPIHMLQGCLFGLKKMPYHGSLFSIKKMSPKNLPTRAGEHHSPLSRGDRCTKRRSSSLLVSRSLASFCNSVELELECAPKRIKMVRPEKSLWQIWQNQILRKGFG